ncbi:MAG: orotidine-5'-phosphate decarboxylase [Candidatus Omnitrophica bacterium]|nr:orotidine-5'-phosphate decarboxylase [Candidatus Omnitrophota bacterium]
MKKVDRQDKLILALDVSNKKEAQKFMRILAGSVKIVKIGPVLFTAYGPEIVRYAQRLGYKVFLDLKFHDIPNTVAEAVRQAVRLDVFMLTLHAQGGDQMLCTASKAAKEEAQHLGKTPPILLAVTVLTSHSEEKYTKDIVVKRAKLALECGLDGIVCSVKEVQLVRNACGRKLLIITPGIRPSGCPAGDQKRIATAEEAFKEGADYIVVGRPILEAKEPLEMIRKCLEF